MKYGILGATGPTGLALLQELAGEDVTVYVRSPEKLPPTFKGHAVKGQLADTASLRSWASGCDVVLNALGHTSLGAQIPANLGLGTYAHADMITNAMAVVISGRPKRIVDCSAYGTRATRQDLPFVFRGIFLPLLLGQSYRDHEHNEANLEKSGIPYVIALPGMLTNGPRTGVYRTEKRFPGGKTVKISRADVAHFMVRAAKGTEFLNQCVGLGY